MKVPQMPRIWMCIGTAWSVTRARYYHRPRPLRGAHVWRSEAGIAVEKLQRNAVAIDAHHTHRHYRRRIARQTLHLHLDDVAQPRRGEIVDENKGAGLRNIARVRILLAHLGMAYFDFGAKPRAGKPAIVLNRHKKCLDFMQLPRKPSTAMRLR